MFPDLLRQRMPDLTGDQIGRLEEHYKLLQLWNKKLNLTTINGLVDVVERHYCESIFLAQHLPPGSLHIADIGSGPGFPGFPVAVLRPDCVVTLVESHQRKAVFLREASRKLSNVRVVAQRADELGGRFDVAVSRAVSYRDLEPSLSRLAQKAMLLTGTDSPPESLGFAWEPPVLLPWGDRRFLRVGSVSRETNG